MGLMEFRIHGGLSRGFSEKVWKRVKEGGGWRNGVEI